MKLYGFILSIPAKFLELMKTIVKKAINADKRNRGHGSCRMLVSEDKKRLKG